MANIMSLFLAEKALINSSEFKLGNKLMISLSKIKIYLEQEHDFIVWRQFTLSDVFQVVYNFPDFTLQAQQSLDFLLNIAWQWIEWDFLDFSQQVLNSNFFWLMSLNSGFNVEKGFVYWTCVLINFLLCDECLSWETKLIAVFDIDD